MTDIETLIAKLRLLPDDKQAEVADFVDFLLARLPQELEAEQIDQILNETAGIWSDELPGLEYENRMRQMWRRDADANQSAANESAS